MKLFRYITAVALSLTIIGTVSAREDEDAKSNKNQGNVKSKAANCAPATSLTEMHFNNVRTAVSTAGNTWYDRGDGNPYYNVPAEGDAHAIFNGSLWLGGEDPAGNLKLAAIQFNQTGHDFWPGPLTTDGEATIGPETCAQWDEQFPISRTMVETHLNYYRTLARGEDPSEIPLFEDGYTIPEEILNYPAHGNQSQGQSFYLAPFRDFVDPTTGEVVGTEGLYEPELGDYPDYDLTREIDCRTRMASDPVPLFGDFTLWWIFNDKGNIHTESGGEPIGMEIQAQGFAFATNDEINNMTFYNYTLINRGSLTLNNTYFGQWTDTDLGCFNDDLVGCDVARGLGYSYNGDNNDADCEGSIGYGVQPPAIGIDFFEGPYQDDDGINNEYGIGEGQAINGLGYYNPEDSDPDTIVDNERFGMRRFLYHTNPSQGGAPATQDPDIAIEYYNFLRGIWKDGTPMTFGGTGYNPGGDNLQADFMFPGETDPLHWGTDGVDPNYPLDGGWTEENEGNAPSDRRFIQSAGPFTLDPGEFNNITVGAVFARATTGGPFESVELLRIADDKAQSLFENCFRLLEGPRAPELTAQELDEEVILYLTNNNPLSNNVNESYIELDPTIPDVDTSGNEYTDLEQSYRFEGYQVYQLANDEVSVADLDDPELARLVYQGDIENYNEDGQPIGQLVNYEFDAEIELPVPTLQVDGANEGISHSIRVTEDLFSQGSGGLINYREYYFLAIAYAYNNYENYNPQSRSGQNSPYLAGRSSATGAEITAITVIPHDPTAESGGTVVNSEYGDELPITRIEGKGNGNNDIELTFETEEAIMEGAPWKVDHLDYEQGAGPVNVKVIDPLNVKDARFQLKIIPAMDDDGDVIEDLSQASWELRNLSDPEAEVITSNRSLDMPSEQLIAEYGISINITQYEYINSGSDDSQEDAAEPIRDELVFPDGREWLTGTSDIDGNTLQNWIRSGTSTQPDLEDCPTEGYSGAPCYYPLDQNGDPVYSTVLDPCFYYDYNLKDEDQIYESLINGTVAPFRLTAYYDCGPMPSTNATWSFAQSTQDQLSQLHSVELVITPDKSKWTRCPVLEMQADPAQAQGGAEKMFPRARLSVDKNGRNQNDPNVNEDEATYNGEQVDGDGMSYGMGWFPGYAINVETGERLNLAFGEDSYLASDNGRDMLWNPSSRVQNTVGNTFVFGGQHYVYVFRNRAEAEQDEDGMPLYDGGQFLYENIAAGTLERRSVWRAASWVMNPLISTDFNYRSVEEGLVPAEARVKLRVAKPYDRYAAAAEELGEESTPFVPLENEEYQEQYSENDWYPMYEFSTNSAATVVENEPVAENHLDNIAVVPNPYYAYSGYETGRLDKRVKFINLPQQCTIQIYNLNGDLIRTLEKDNPLTFLDWDLENEQRIPVAGGVYICHIDAPGLGEHIVKFFASMRPQDLNSF